MKLKLTALLAASLLACSSAFANTVTIAPSGLPLPVNPANGGPFSATATGALNGTFTVFCLELNESLGSGPYTYTLDSFAARGGLGGAVGNQDELSAGSAYLMGKYGSNINASNSAALQLAFWILENEIAAPAAGVNSFFDEASGIFVNPFQDAGISYLNQQGVIVMNILDPLTDRRDRFFKQSVLVKYVPDSGTTLILLGCSLGFVGFVSRRFRR